MRFRSLLIRRQSAGFRLIGMELIPTLLRIFGRHAWGVHVGQLPRFVYDLQIGDIVVFPSSSSV
jgi:hypothetical protein